MLMFKAVEESAGSYKGWWLNGKRHCQGTQKWKSGSEYVGEWADDNKHGQETYKSKSSGNEHIGEYRDDKRNRIKIEVRLCTDWRVR